MSVSTTNPVTVRFTLKDDIGAPVDRLGAVDATGAWRTGAYSLNRPMAMTFSLSYYSTTPGANGGVIASPYTVYTKTASGSTPTVFSPTAYNPSGNPAQGTIVQNAPGDYTYTFPSADITATSGAVTKAVTYDSTALSKNHVVWIQATRQMDLVDATNPKTFYALNKDYWFIPAGGTPVEREVATNALCMNCHRGFRPEAAVANEFHSGGRIDVQYCGVCHNPARASNTAAEASVFIHRIHYGRSLRDDRVNGVLPTGGVNNLFHNLVATYPQDIRSCETCHAGALQGGQFITNPTRQACGSCHDVVDFGENSVLPMCTIPTTFGANGKPVPCAHLAGPQTDDLSCANNGCHSPTSAATRKHTPVAPPDPNNLYANPTSGNANTNAAWLTAGNFVPTGANVITYDVRSVDAVVEVAADGGVSSFKRPSITFKLKRDGVDYVFPGYVAGSVTELIPNFVGSPSVYFVYALPQDGIATPADWNVTASGYLKNIWNGTATGTAAGVLSGPDGTGYYTVKLTGVQVPANATMLAGGLGYTYSLTTTQPLTQTNVSGYAYNTTTRIGGLIVPAPNVWKTATGFSPRRTIVDNAKCKACHSTLGVAPTFHAAQRNDGPSCAFCHTPNRTSAGWSANAKDSIHAIHAGGLRDNPFTWHAVSATEGFAEVAFPSRHNDCQACHTTNGYDFSNAAAQAAVPRMLSSTVAQGRYNSDPAFNPTSYFTVSPYVNSSNAVDYGFGFATSDVTYSLPDGLSGTGFSATGVAQVCSAASPCLCTTGYPCTQAWNAYPASLGTPVKVVQGSGGSAVTCIPGSACTITACTTASRCTVTVRTCTTSAPCEADDGTLVKSPITSACSACHDSSIAIGHMLANGGRFYDRRDQSTPLRAPRAAPEQCLVCHGPGKVSAIAEAHR